MKTLLVPTLNEDEPSAGQLCRLWQEAGGDGVEVRFDFSQCKFLRQNAVAFLGGLARLVEYRGGRVELAWNTLADKVGKNLAQNGFMHAFGVEQGPWSGNSIPYRQDAASNPRGFQDYLAHQWLGRGWIGVSDALRDAVVGRVVEAYLNVFDHAKSPIGLFTCGQHFPNNHTLNLSMIDFGVGIPSNVRLFMANQCRPEDLPADKCMEWAFQTGTSTKPGTGRGLGLDLLRAFVQQNKGRLEMFSHEGYALVTGERARFSERPSYFEGTLVNISLRCDERFYCLASELSNEPLF